MNFIQEHLGAIGVMLFIIFAGYGIYTDRKEKQRQREEAMFQEANKSYEGEEDIY